MLTFFILPQLLKMEPQLKSAQKQRDEYKVQLDDEKRRVKEVKDELTTCQRTLADVQRAVEQYKRDIKHKEHLLDEARQRITAISAQLQTLRYLFLIPFSDLFDLLDFRFSLISLFHLCILITG